MRKRNAHHHERRDHRFGARHHPLAAVRGDMHKHFQRHQRIAADDLADAVGVVAFLVRAQRLERVDRFAQDRDLGAAEMIGPSREVVQGSDQSFFGGHSASTLPSSAATRPSSISP